MSTIQQSTSQPSLILTTMASYLNDDNKLNNISNKNESNFGEAFYEYTRMITGLYLYPTVSIFGIFGGLMNFLVYKNSKRYSTNLYLIALSLSDIVKLLNDVLYFVVNVAFILDKNFGNLLFTKIYNYSHYIFIVTALNTSWLTCAIAFDRYVSICGHHIKKKPFNNLQSILTIVGVVMVSALLAIPSPLFLQSVLDESTNYTTYKLVHTKLHETTFRTFYQLFTGFLRAVIPLFILIYLNFHIIKFVYENKLKQKAWLKVKTKSRSTHMLITIVIIFIVCIFPDAIMTMMRLGYATESNIVKGIREITDFLLLVNSASTFPICFYFSIDYRNKFKQIFYDNCGFFKLFQSLNAKKNMNNDYETHVELLDQ